MFVDASAIVAILTREAEADALADVLENSRSAVTSPIAILRQYWGSVANGMRAPKRSSTTSANSRGGGSPDRPDYRQGGAHCTCGFLPLRQGTRASRTTQPWRLLCVCNGKERRDDTAVQRRRFRQDRHTCRRAVTLNTQKQWRPLSGPLKPPGAAP